MCLILFSYEPEKCHRLVVIANRDEFYDRPSEKAHIWTSKDDDENDVSILAGKDLVGGGTWLGINPKRNRFAAVTNYRDGPTENELKAKKSRGSLPTEFLKSEDSTIPFLSEVHREGADYNGFNMIAFDGHTLGYTSNRSDDEPKKLVGGVYGLSNHLLDTPWPKVVKGTNMLKEFLLQSSKDEHDSREISIDMSILDILLDKEKPPDASLPDTGVGIFLERAYSSLFVEIESIEYGTRCSSLVAMDSKGPLYFAEKSFVSTELNLDTVIFDFRDKDP